MAPNNIHELWLTLASKGHIEEANFVAGLEAQQVRIRNTLRDIANGHSNPMELARQQLQDIFYK